MINQLRNLMWWQSRNFCNKNSLNSTVMHSLTLALEQLNCHAEFILGNKKLNFHLRHCHNWNNSSCKTRIYPSCLFNTMVTDDLMIWQHEEHHHLWYRPSKPWIFQLQCHKGYILSKWPPVGHIGFILVFGLTWVCCSISTINFSSTILVSVCFCCHARRILCIRHHN